MSAKSRKPENIRQRLECLIQEDLERQIKGTACACTICRTRIQDLTLQLGSLRREAA